MTKNVSQSRFSCPSVFASVLLLSFVATMVFSTVDLVGNGSTDAFASEETGVNSSQVAADSLSQEEKPSPPPFKTWMVGLILGIMGGILALIVVNFFYLQRKLMTLSREEGMLESYMQLPFGVPSGTIRSVVTFVVVSFCLILIGFNVFYKELELPQILANVLMAIIAFYFGSRTAARPTERATQELQKEVQAARKESQGLRVEKILGETKSLLTVVDNLKDTFLPEEEGEKSKLGSFITKAKEKITAAESALKGGDFDMAKTAVNVAKDILSGKNPSRRILQNASGIFSSILGSVPGLGFLGSMVRIGASLGGRYYDSWKKKILNAPIHLSDITPEIITATTAYSIYLNVDLFKQKFRQQIIDQDNQFLLSSLRDFLSLDNNSLWEKYKEEFKEEDRETFMAAADEVRRRLLDYDLKDRIEIKNLERIENLEVFNEYLDKVSDDREGAKALTSLMNLVDNAKAKNLNLVENLETFKKEEER